MPGTTINFAPGVNITLNGRLDVAGTSTCKVTLQPMQVGGHWSGIAIQNNGVLTMHHAVQVGGGIITGAPATVSIFDSELSRALGDWLVMRGGTVDIEYSSLGLEPGNVDTSHCDMHLNAYGNVITVTHSNVSTAAYGMMFYGGTNANFTYDNWFANAIDVYTELGSPVSADFSHGWFEKGAPAPANGSVFTLDALATSRLTDAGPRP
jgi:hypothetical protein